ncbi:MAG: hypothetical protein J6035_00975 [Bacteroidaceae bacterium]|jgi:hypothetical protein|nr:hypothetical protein [Bacteroidaceae bacterium]
MSLWSIILIAWAVFCALVYICAYIDYAYYRYNLSEKFSQLMDAITEDE